jgi:hypothetical protein
MTCNSCYNYMPSLQYMQVILCGNGCDDRMTRQGWVPEHSSGRLEFSGLEAIQGVRDAANISAEPRPVYGIVNA